MSAAPLVFGSPEAQIVVQRDRDQLWLESLRAVLDPLKARLKEAQREAEYWRDEARRLEDEIRKLEKGETK